MSRKVRRVQFHLDSKDITHLPYEEIAAILRGADNLIASGGRTMLSKLLKGSKEKKLLELELDKNPSYGYYKSLSIEDVLAKIDWVIKHKYFFIRYDYRLPLLVYSPKGWEIEKDTYSTELLKGFDEMIESGADIFDMTYLRDRNRELISLLLEKVKRTGDKKYIPLLKAWAAIDYHKVRQEINSVISFLLK